jgi:hypothetical protein
MTLCTSYHTAPDPQYGDKPMMMVRGLAGDLLNMLQQANVKKLQKAAEKLAKDQEKKRIAALRRGVQEEEGYDLSPFVTEKWKPGPMIPTVLEGGGGGGFGGDGGSGGGGGGDGTQWPPEPQPQWDAGGGDGDGEMSAEQIASMYGGNSSDEEEMQPSSFGQDVQPSSFGQGAPTAASFAEEAPALAPPADLLGMFGAPAPVPAADSVDMFGGMETMDMAGMETFEEPPPAPFDDAPVPSGGFGGGGGGGSGLIVDKVMGWVLESTSPDERPTPPDVGENLREGLKGLDEDELVQVAHFIAGRVEFNAVPVKLKSLVLISGLIEAVPAFKGAVTATCVEAVGAQVQFECEPDPSYGDKPMLMVRAKASEVHGILTRTPTKAELKTMAKEEKKTKTKTVPKLALKPSFKAAGKQVVNVNRMQGSSKGMFEQAQCQFGGKGNFVEVTMDLAVGGKFIITEEKSGTVREVSVLGCQSGNPKNARKGHAHQVRLDTLGLDSTGESKFIFSVDSDDSKDEWLHRFGRYAGIGPDGEALPVIRFKVLQEAPYFKEWTKDNKVLGVLAPGEFIEAFETKMDMSVRPVKNKARHAMGWTPQTAPDGSVVLEVVVEEKPKDAAVQPMMAVSVAPPTFDTIEDFNTSMIEPGAQNPARWQVTLGA